MSRAALLLALALALLGPAGGSARAQELRPARVESVLRLAPSPEPGQVRTLRAAPRRPMPRARPQPPPAIARAPARSAPRFLLHRSLLR